MAGNSGKAKGTEMKFGNLERHFTEKNFGTVIDILNTGLTKLAFVDNFPGKMIEVNSLKKDEKILVSKKGYLILKQSGNGILSGNGVIKGELMELQNFGPNELTGISIFSME